MLGTIILLNGDATKKNFFPRKKTIKTLRYGDPSFFFKGWLVQEKKNN
jgi:hypothetical protein